MPSQCVPEFYASVGCAASADQQAVLVWRPGKSFDSSLMVLELELRLIQFLDIPHHELVIIAS